MRRQGGFSLIELLIVVAIIMIIAAIAIPNLIKSKIAANEASAVYSMRAINTAQMSYQSTYPSDGFADNLNKLGPPPVGTLPTNVRAGLVDDIIGCAAQPCPKSGYSFSIVNTAGTPVSAYEINALPLAIGRTGNRGFCSDASGVIRFDLTGGNTCTQALN